MITMVIGGSGSGKSEFAENIAVTSSKPLIYIATMQPFGEETLRKIERHHELRKEKGFHTIEQYIDIEKATSAWTREATVLLECMSNLLANEKYRPQEDSKKPLTNLALVEKIVQGIVEIEASCSHLVIVTNDVFASGEVYEEETMDYLRILGEINECLAKKADTVIEVVCGIPIWIKGNEDKLV